MQNQLILWPWRLWHLTGKETSPSDGGLFQMLPGARRGAELSSEWSTRAFPPHTPSGFSRNVCVLQRRMVTSTYYGFEFLMRGHIQ